MTALLIAVTYFGVVSTARADAADLRSQTEDAQDLTRQLRKRVAKLAEEKKNEKKLTATRDLYRDALPSGSGVPAFLRQLQASGTALQVDISGISVGTPGELQTLPGVWSIQIQLSAEGTPAHLYDLLRELQGSEQKRAVLVESANLSIGEKEEETQLSLSLSAFVAPPAGSGAPTVTTD
ncbi:hypothetical protein AB0J80_17995 [Actinoplanes sp. NPDC049548]|uniref:hypothetical protein n=1 Tax=Actinoplanes sp. NPDC049548 TaxID=3155152 RepID=UPI003443B516